MQSILRIFQVDPVRSGVGRESGRPYEMQDAQCALLQDDGTVSQVGVLTLPKELNGKVLPGDYIGTFALRVSMKDRKIGASLVGLQPYGVKGSPAPSAAPAAPVKG